ncbi:hypothetical protein [Arthrobacter mobilis]|uniref:Uncharacterized protein n=1 Tax=Arthrobacter mobilis TaxID=2724944 RepID=A0A7X6HHS0_9MICC|nr:hypothetical protein [Arthrobacter mobilis]NKX56012.1 hypothetical protein [Arthrobacter mobilis]
MPTGSKHKRTTEIEFDGEGNEMRRYFVECRCTLGEDHDDAGVVHSPYSGDEEDEGEAISVYDAADIWRSSGMDEDYTFGYSEDELGRAADEK